MQQLLGERAAVYSAGVETHGLNPRAVHVMAEDGGDIAPHPSNHVAEYAAAAFDYAITVCDQAQEVCPVFSSSAQKLPHNFAGPARATGSEQKVLRQFRAVRNKAQAYAQILVHEHVAASPRQRP